MVPGMVLEVLRMVGRNINRENLIAVRLLRIRRHFLKCKECRGARSAKAFDELCDWAKMELIEVAVAWDTNLAGRLAARNSGSDYMYPCPDTNAHGPAYALTAEAVIVTGKQDKLF